MDVITLAVDTNTWKTSSCVNYYIIFKYYPTLTKVLSNVDKSVVQRLAKSCVTLYKYNEQYGLS